MFRFLEKNKKLLVYLPLLVYWIVLFISTSLPLQNVPSIGLNDKLMHTLAYAGLAVLLFLTLSFQKKFVRLYKSPVLYTFLFCMIYAVLDELHQLLIPGRRCDIIDIIADGIGVIFGLAIISVIYHFGSVKTQKAGT